MKTHIMRCSTFLSITDLICQLLSILERGENMLTTPVTADELSRVRRSLKVTWSWVMRLSITTFHSLRASSSTTHDKEARIKEEIKDLLSPSLSCHLEATQRRQQLHSVYVTWLKIQTVWVKGVLIISIPESNQEKKKKQTCGYANVATHCT